MKCRESSDQIVSDLKGLKYRPEMTYFTLPENNKVKGVKIKVHTTKQT